MSGLISTSSAQTASLLSGGPSVSLSELEFKQEPGRLVKSDGTILEGSITFSMTNDGSLYYFKKDKDQIGEKIKAKDLKSLTFNNGRNFSVYENSLYELISPVNKKIVIYRKFSSFGILGTTIEGGKAKGHFKDYVCIPGKLELTSTESIKFMNSFDTTVSALLTDCPELSNKIKERKDGYKMNLLTAPGPVWMRIAREYENCE